MEKKNNLCFRFASLLLFILLLLPRLTLSAYTCPEKFYVNCGSDSNVIYGNRNFVGDINSGDNSVSFTGAQEVRNNPKSSGIYQTVRIFKQTSSYKFKLDFPGLHFVRLHFFAPSSSLSASFNVSANHHFLKSFSVQNLDNETTPLVEEFLLMLNSPKFELRFVPDRSSVAFVNAIEVFPAPPNDQLAIIPSDSDKNLRMVYRLNVGTKKITPENDTLGRTWSLDDEFLSRKDSAVNIGPKQERPNYDDGDSNAATNFTAPDFVYQTAKTINRSSSTSKRVALNVTWSFKVKSNSRHFVRFHFSDIKSQTVHPDFDFYLFVNGKSRKDVKPSEKFRLSTPFYIDVVVNVSDGSGFLNVSIGAKDPDIDAGFLNGLEVMEFLRYSEDFGSDSDFEDGSSFRRVYIIVGCAVAGSVLFLSMLFMVFLKRRRSNNTKKKNTRDTEVSVYKGSGSSASRCLGLKIPFNDILRATKNFDEKWLIGKGGFGDVYKAILPDGSKAAIKRGKGGSGQGILEFKTEIQVLSKIRHKHLVSLTGYCEENSEMILVYEFMEKGTLKEHLYGGSDFPTLSWKQRLEICIGAARGLQYLHNGPEGAIIHRDVKSTNILLDENNLAKVADFGLSKLTVRDCNQDQINVISTNIKGTFGYLDPEYLETHILTEKSDVYAFGVVLLEVLCARPALTRYLPEEDRYLPEEEVNLAEWAMFCKLKGLTDEIIDPKLSGQIELNSLRKFMEIAEKCLKECGGERPSMSDVVWDLEYALQLQTMTNIHREPHEDSATTICSNSLVIPRLMTIDSFSSNSIVP